MNTTSSEMASGTGAHLLAGNTDKPVQASQILSYSTAAQKDRFPSREQAIVIEAKDGVQLKEYVRAIGTIVEPVNIKFASRISNNRICIFLKSKELAEETVNKHQNITIREQTHEIRLLLTRHKRIILSNVCPSIPHSFIESIIDDQNIRRSSSISYLKAGIGDEYTHVLSFRRQMYIHPDDLAKMPQSIQITYENDKFWIYLSTDTLQCFVCQQAGHIASKCPTMNVTEKPQNNAKSDLPIDSEPPVVKNVNAEENIITENTDVVNTTVVETDIQPTFVSPNNLKRSCSVISSNTSAASVPTELTFKNTTSNDTKVKNPKKKKADTSKKSLDEMIEPLRSTLNSSGKLLNFLQFKSLLENVHGSTDALNISKSYCENIADLIALLDELYPLLHDGNMKSRFTRLKKKLKKQSSEDTSFSQDAGSESQQTSDEEAFQSI